MFCSICTILKLNKVYVENKLKNCKGNNKNKIMSHKIELGLVKEASP